MTETIGDIFSHLNAEQAKAVRYTDGPLLILAGAGSGKTRVLVHRIAYLIREAGVPPWSILGITFTNKAAKEMKTRIDALLPDESASVWISTFHAACVRILRRDIERIGYSRWFTILDTDDQLSLIKECIKEINLSDKIFIPKTVLDHIGRAKDETVGPEEYERRNGADTYGRNLSRIYSVYQQKLKKQSALDFDDIILLTIDLLNKCDDVRNYYQNKFKYVMVDEYQDTNTAQYVLISLLSGKWRNLCVVGDDDQSIYGWRGANIRNILDFEKEYRDAKIIKLEQNYRSTKVILSAANSVIGYNSKRKQKSLWTENEEGSAINCLLLDNEHEEGLYVARAIKKRHRENGTGYNDFAALYRMNAQSRALENMLVREGIPYRIIGGFKFFDRKEIKDIIAYLRLIQNPADDISYKRVINSPKRGIGATTIQKIEVLAAGRGASMFETTELAARNPKAYPELKSAAEKLGAFAGLIRGFIDDARGATLLELLDAVIQRSGVYAAYASDMSEEARARLENIMELKSEVLEFEKNYGGDDGWFADGDAGEGAGGNEGASVAVGEGAGVEHASGAGGLSGGAGVEDAGGAGDAGDDTGGAGVEDAGGAGEGAGDSGAAGGGIGGAAGERFNMAAAGSGTLLPQFLAHVALVSDIDSYDEENEKVSLMTVHSAKGLEYDSVFIVGAEDGIFPGQRSMLDQSKLEEERRLCYVAITRAKKRLIVTRARSRTLFGNTVYNPISRFIADIPGELLDDGTGASRKKKPATEWKPRKNTYADTARADHNPLRAGAGSSRADAGGAKTDSYENGRAYAIGDKVNHKKYGGGTISNRYKSKGDMIIEIVFEDAGLKRFIESMVSLRIEGDV